MKNILFTLALLVSFSSCGQTSEEYLNRGVSKEILGDLNGACADWKKAAALGYTKAAQWVANQCN